MQTLTSGYVDTAGTNTTATSPATTDDIDTVSNDHSPQSTSPNTTDTNNTTDVFNQVKHKVYTADLSFIEDRLIRVEGWKVRATKQVIEQYRNFLLLLWKYPNDTLPPSTDIDEAWHAHILYTRAYQAFCKDVFGKYLEHQPSTESMDASFANTLRYYEHEFGAPLCGIRSVGWRYIKVAFKKIWAGL